MSASGRFRWRFILNIGDKKKGGNLPAKGKVATKIMCVEWIYSSTAAWAAAKRAMGTRKGEQDT